MRKLNDEIKSILVNSVAVVVIMMLLQPFGTNGIREYKWLVIAGYGVMTFIGCGIAELITTFIFRLKRDAPSEYTFPYRRHIVLVLLTVPVLGALICSYDAQIFMGGFYKGWLTADGTFTFGIFRTYCLYVAAVSVFIVLFGVYRNKTRALTHYLQKATELNRILTERQNNALASETTAKDEPQKIIIRGTTRESIELQAENLLYIEAEGNYAQLVCLTAGKVVSKTLRCTMKQMEETFAAYPQIVRCHRAFLVNTAQIRRLTGNSKGFQLTLNGTEKKIPTSKTYTPKIHDLIENQA